MAGAYLDIGGVSHHTDSWAETYLREHPGSKSGGAPKNYNESNPGLGFRYEWGDPADLAKFVMAGGYRNSYGKDSYYAGGGLLKRIAGGDNYNLNAGVMAGGVTGYEQGVTPAVLPMLSAGIKDMRINLMYTPKTSETSETFMLSGSYKLSSDKDRSARIKENMVNKE